jgi:hypothetical protein
MVDNLEETTKRAIDDNDPEAIPVEYRAQGGAEVSIDFAHDKNGPDAPHVRWQTSGKNNEVGHIILDEVPAGRSNNKLDRSQY